MTALTVWGTAAATGDVSAHYGPTGRLESAHTINEIDLVLPADPIRVTISHDPNLEVGELVHAELDAAGKLRCVAVLDDDRLLGYEGDLFFSPDYIGYGTGLRERAFTAERAELTGLAITPSPAGLAAKASPLKMRSGDVRDSGDRYSWEIGWASSTPLLQRAVEQRSRNRSRTPTSIIGPGPEIVPMGNGAWLVDGELVATGERHSDTELSTGVRPAGPWRHSAPYRGIISVR